MLMPYLLFKMVILRILSLEPSWGFFVKEGIKFLIQSLKADSMLCGHENYIYLYGKNVFICFIIPNEDSMVRGTTFHFYCDEERFN